ncbi:12647_t:CDS:2, partial [Dentiscutata heterogama]
RKDAGILTPQGLLANLPSSTLLPDRSTRKGQLGSYAKDCLELSCVQP